jgi:hypothetical protein
VNKIVRQMTREGGREPLVGRILLHRVGHIEVQIGLLALFLCELLCS